MNCELCEKTFPNNSKLKRHKANIHDIDVVLHQCSHCEYNCKDKYNLKKHIANKHNINVTWYPCNVKNCDLRFKSTSDLKRHKSAKHNIGVKFFYCDLCEYKFKTKPNLTRHIRTVHNIDPILYPCNECDYAAKSSACLHSHKERKHSLNKKWYHCDLCKYKSVSKTDLYTHKQGMHNINVKWHYCPIKDCTYKAKRNYLLKEHLGYLHDIGDLQCDFCTENRYKLVPYTKKKVTSHICRTCLRKVTGRDSRVEIIMSKYLDTHFGTDFLVGSDTKIYGEACQSYRPDKLYASPGIVLQIECDEYQHFYSGNDYSCDEKRISDIYDEFPGQKYFIIRWNPDKYKLPKGKKRITTKIDKMELLLSCMADVLQNPPEEQIKIIYMFYDKDNPLISKNIPHVMIYDQDDIDTF